MIELMNEWMNERMNKSVSKFGKSISKISKDLDSKKINAFIIIGVDCITLTDSNSP